MSGLVAERTHPAGGVILRFGSFWGAASVRWAASRLRHRGPAHTIHHSKASSLLVQGVEPLVSEERDACFWTWGLEKSAHRDLFAQVREGSLAARLARQYPKSTIILFQPGRGRVEVLRGSRQGGSLFFAKRRGSLFLAPERKAFSDIRDRGEIRQLDAGQVLRFSAGANKVLLSYAEFPSPIAEPDRLDYASNCRRTEEHLSGRMRDIAENHPGPLTLALSGGLDSAITALLAREAGIEIEAWTVWFDSGSSQPTVDLQGARSMADALNLPHREIRIGPEDIEPLARESVFTLEESNWRHVETGTYLLRLTHELANAGRTAVLTGTGGDRAFAGAGLEIDPGRDFEGYLRRLHQQPFFMARILEPGNIELLSPFAHESTLEFARNLPPSFLIRRTDSGVVGKRILRDTFGSRLPNGISTQDKRYPFETSGIEALFAKMWGTRKARENRYKAWLEELIPLPRFRRKRGRFRNWFGV